jgi:hypothetical protein
MVMSGCVTGAIEATELLALLAAVKTVAAARATPIVATETPPTAKPPAEAPAAPLAPAAVVVVVGAAADVCANTGCAARADKNIAAITADLLFIVNFLKKNIIVGFIKKNTKIVGIASVFDCV